MSFTVEPVRPEDLEDFTSVIFRSHCGEVHLINCVYPDNLTKEGQIQALKRIQASMSRVEHTKWEKVTNTATGEIVGAATWATFKTRKPTNGPEGEQKELSLNEEYVQELMSSIAKTESQFWKDNALPFISLSILAVLPEHQHKGVGTLLVNSGLKYADSIGAKASIISNDASGSFYEKFGFKVESHIALEVSEKFSAEEKVWIFFLVRDRSHDS